MARLSREHLQPLIGRLQRPAVPVTRGELAWLRRARRVLPEYAAEFRATVHQLRSQARSGPILPTFFAAEECGNSHLCICC